ncbi:unnamed protein product [Ambrosiozyma monospora]|uniref:Unnamed protein product n=1 Tax=Ambrosiozyma monospora TaxID=43982 RepID=A0A9W6Z091_AMBMO|nr:unnamed protein product [Ambrosiozyma monospora]
MVSNYLTEESAKQQRTPEYIICDRGTEFQKLFIEEKRYDKQGNIIPIKRNLKRVGENNKKKTIDNNLYIVMDAPTADNQFNDTAERIVQTMKVMNTLVTSHLTDVSIADHYMHINPILDHDSLQYIATKGRFDIQYYASTLAQYNHCPTVLHYHQCLQVFKYLWSTRHSYYEYPISKTPISEVTLSLYTDAAQKKTSGQGGYLIFINNILYHICIKVI